MSFDTHMRLSKHFTLAEFIKSNTADKYKMPNTPREESEVANIKALCLKVLEPMRAIYNTSMTVTSGFRCATLNRLVGGAAASQHLFGEAADIVIKDPSIVTLATATRCRTDIPFDQLIFESRWRDGRWSQWIHVSHKRLGKNRGEVLTIVMKDGERTTRQGIHDPDHILKGED